MQTITVLLIVPPRNTVIYQYLYMRIFKKFQKAIFFYKYVFINSSPGTECDTKSIFISARWNVFSLVQDLNSKFSFSQTRCLTKAEEPPRPYYLPIAGGTIIGFIPFPRVLVLGEMYSASSRIWTRVAVCISLSELCLLNKTIVLVCFIFRFFFLGGGLLVLFYSFVSVVIVVLYFFPQNCEIKTI